MGVELKMVVEGMCRGIFLRRISSCGATGSLHKSTRANVHKESEYTSCVAG